MLLTLSSFTLATRLHLAESNACTQPVAFTSTPASQRNINFWAFEPSGRSPSCTDAHPSFSLWLSVGWNRSSILMLSYMLSLLLPCCFLFCPASSNHRIFITLFVSPHIPSSARDPTQHYTLVCVGIQLNPAGLPVSLTACDALGGCGN